jgi:predicted nucleic acid-binding protein
VQTWIANPPLWIEVRDDSPMNFDALLEPLDRGERAAICLALSLGADLLLMDDRAGVKAALGKGLRVAGTLAILDLAAERGLVDFPSVVGRLAQTNFRRPESLMSALLKKHQERIGNS